MSYKCSCWLIVTSSMGCEHLFSPPGTGHEITSRCPGALLTRYSWLCGAGCFSIMDQRGAGASPLEFWLSLLRKEAPCCVAVRCAHGTIYTVVVGPVPMSTAVVELAGQGNVVPAVK